MERISSVVRRSTMQIHPCPNSILDPRSRPARPAIPEDQPASVAQSNTLHMAWASKDARNTEYWLEQRFPGIEAKVHGILKSQWNWEGVAQATCSGAHMLFRRIGYTYQFVLVSSDNARIDGAKFHYSRGDEASVFEL